MRAARKPPRKKAMVAMSGGVDSSVAAALMVQEGYDVIGVMLKLWRGEAENNASGCCNLGAAEDARRVAQVLGIDFYVLNFAERFDDAVVESFQRDYASGRTPNPCVRCNQWIKFEALLERAVALGADVLATGHYARVRRESGRYRLLRGVDPTKDQSYVLWMLSQEDLARVRFPVGDLHKTRTRQIARELGLRTASKPDSQEICFVRSGDVHAYVDERIPEASRPGPIYDTTGKVLGRHRGIGHYTIGQRKGLGVSLGVPVFVTAIDAGNNSIVVGSRSDLLSQGFTTAETSFTGAVPPAGSKVLVQHRAHGDVAPASIRPLQNGRAAVTFDAPVAAIARGQSAAFYDHEAPERLLGGGIVDATFAAAAAG